MERTREKMEVLEERIFFSQVLYIILIYEWSMTACFLSLLGSHNHLELLPFPFSCTSSSLYSFSPVFTLFTSTSNEEETHKTTTATTITWHSYQTMLTDGREKKSKEWAKSVVTCGFALTLYHFPCALIAEHHKIPWLSLLGYFLFEWARCQCVLQNKISEGEGHKCYVGQCRKRPDVNDAFPLSDFDKSAFLLKIKTQPNWLTLVLILLSKHL